MSWRTEARRLLEAGYELDWPTWPSTWIVASAYGEVRIIQVPDSEFPENGVVDDRDYDD